MTLADSGIILSFSGVSWSPPLYQGDESQPILDGVHLELPRGDWMALTGPSGGGKTTLLSLAAGLLKPSRGTVSLFGQPLARSSEREVATLRAHSLGLIFQNYHLDDSRSTEENILLPGYFSQKSWHELRSRCCELAEELGLSEQLKKPVSVLSGGQRQRVAVARALLISPRLVLADEPTGALDQPTAKLVLDLLHKENRAGVTLLTITHDPVLLKHAKRSAHLEGGRLTLSEQEQPK